MNTHIALLRAFALVFVILAAAACADQGTSARPRIDGAPEVTVSAVDLAFKPNGVTLPASAVNLNFRNDGQTQHDLTIEGLGVHLVARPGETLTTGLHDLKSGRYTAICSVMGHADAGMRMTVTVE